MAEPAVVLVHGLRASRTMWRAQGAILGRAGYRAVAIDLPGHGRRRGERFTLDGAVEALAEGVDAVGGRALVVGLSLGGYVGIAHAAEHPEQVAGLVAAACSTQPTPLVVEAWALAARQIARFPDEGAGLNKFMVEHLVPAPAAADLSAGGFALDVMDDVLHEMASASPLRDIARVQAPVWIVNGRYDHFRSQERRYLAACKDGQLVVVRGAKHLVALDAPVAFGRVVLGALDQLAEPAHHPPRAAQT